MRVLNLNNLPLQRLKESPKVPTKIYMREGDDFLSGNPSGTPYEIELYDSINEAIKLGIIESFNVKGIFDNDNDALSQGLIEGDIYELSSSNTLNPEFEGLLKIVRTNTLIVPQVLGTGILNQTLGTGVPNQIIGI